jgi:hypothetical protein
MEPILLLALLGPALQEIPKEPAAYVRVSPRDPRYFELSDGRPYIPIGINMIAGGEEMMRSLAANGGNYVRFWLSTPYFDVEHEKAGVYDAEKAKRIDAALDLARRLGIRVKLTVEHFREVDVSGKPRQKWANKELHHADRGGTATGMEDWVAGEDSRAQFRRKLEGYAARYKDRPEIFGWELWNEMNAIRGGDFKGWTEAMLPELRRLFPKNLALQSLGSFDTDGARGVYRWLATLRGNDAAQVHRYLDLGASLKVCHGPVDILAAEAVREMREFKPGKPVLLAESGAVEPRHSGPFLLYDKDAAGIILHDVLFAPFFAGAAGAGQCWHWDRYVDKMKLWHHFGRFAEVVKGLDPPAEGFEPLRIDHPRLRVYVLQGRRTTLVWARDKENTWESELKEGRAPGAVTGAVLDLGKTGEGAARIYDPWSNRWTEGRLAAGKLALPEFTRSIAARLESR